MKPSTFPEGKKEKGKKKGSKEELATVLPSKTRLYQFL
jgi:hypothetical protein